MITVSGISLRLTLWFSSILLLGLLLFGAAMWLDLDRALTASRSQTLTRRAERLNQLLREAETASPEQDAGNFRLFANATGGGLIQVYEADGSLAYPSPSDDASKFPWPDNQSLEQKKFTEAHFEGQPYRILSVPYRSNSRSLILCLAAPLAGNNQLLSTFSNGLLRAIPVVLFLSALGGYLLSRKALSPVDRITAAARSISVTNLSARLPVPKTEDELKRLAETCNLMLARLESALNEIKQFTADASHELRSPLSFIRTAAELALQNLHADSDSRLAFKQIKDESAKAGCLLGDMLTLARADAGNVNLVFEKIDLLEVVSDVCDKTRLVAQKRHQTINVALNDAAIVPVWGDYSNLHRLLWTILDNAIKYTDESGIITVSFCSTPFNATVTIEDNGIGIRKADLPHIFQRFYRADTSRGEVDGFGLGLSIAKWIADAHKATISVESEENAGSIFKIVFPVSDDSPSLISLENKVSAGQQS